MLLMHWIFEEGSGHSGKWPFLRASQTWRHCTHLPFLQLHGVQVTLMVSSTLWANLTQSHSTLTPITNLKHSTSCFLSIMMNLVRLSLNPSSSYPGIITRNEGILLFILWNSASPPSINSHFLAALPGMELWELWQLPDCKATVSSLKPLLSIPLWAMFINNHRIFYQMGRIWPLLHRHI